MKHCILLFITALCFTIQANSQTVDIPEQEKGDFLLVASFEERGGGLGQNSAIFITAGNEIADKQSLNRPFDEENLVILAEVLNAVKDEGYELVTTSGAGSGENDKSSQSYFIFQKK